MSPQTYFVPATLQDPGWTPSCIAWPSGSTIETYTPWKSNTSSKAAMNISRSYNESRISINFWGIFPVVYTSWVWQVPVQSRPILFHVSLLSCEASSNFEILSLRRIAIIKSKIILQSASIEDEHHNPIFLQVLRKLHLIFARSAKCPSSSKPKGPSPGHGCAHECSC